MKTTIITIETAALPKEKLDALMPKFSAPANYSKPEAIAKSIAEQTERFIEKAKFEPLTGQIVAVGILPIVDGVPGEPTVIASPAPELEKALIQQVIDAYTESDRIAGWYLLSFILPFVIHRAWNLGVKVPLDLLTDASSRRPLVGRTTDLTHVFNLGDIHSKPALDTTLTFLYGEKQAEKPLVEDLLAQEKDDEATAQITEKLTNVARLAKTLGCDVATT